MKSTFICIVLVLAIWTPVKLKAVFMFASGMAGCSSAGPSATSCEIDVSGNLADTASMPPCVTVQTSPTRDWLLTVDTSSNAIARLAASIDLGATPTPGELSSDTITTWDVEALSSSSSCAFTAGGASVPTGSFALSLDSVDTTKGIAHGTLHVVTYVHAPPATDCGPGEIENVTLVF